MSSQLPISHQASYQAFYQFLKQARSQLTDSPTNRSALKSAVAQLQSRFQTEILSLNSDDLEPAIVHHVQSYQVEMHKQLRLLNTDVTFLQAARQVTTTELRQRQVGDRLETLIRYCEAIMR